MKRKATATIQMNVWTIERHSGRTHDNWHKIRSGLYEIDARIQYKKLCEDLRQGGLRLIAPDGSIKEMTTSPRLRTRW